MKRLQMLFAAVAVVVLSGCAAFGKPREVFIPVAMSCDATVPGEPAWATGILTPDADIYDQTKTLLAERRQAKGYQDELRTALLECTRDPDDDEDDEDEDDED